MTDKQMTKDETIQACCKLLAKLLSEQAKEINATEVKIKLNQIINKDGEFVGDIMVTWNYDKDTEFEETEELSDIFDQLDKLQATNKYLKSKVKHYEQLLKLDITKLETAAELKPHADYLKTTGSILLVEENRKLKQTFIEIQKIVKPYQRNIDKICGHCRRYDGCHACCIDDINCYQYKKPTTPACDKYCELKEFEINNIANQILQKISEII